VGSSESFVTGLRGNLTRAASRQSKKKACEWRHMPKTGSTCDGREGAREEFRGAGTTRTDDVES